MGVERVAPIDTDALRLQIVGTTTPANPKLILPPLPALAQSRPVTSARPDLDEFSTRLRELAGEHAFERATRVARAQRGAVHEYLLRRGAIGDEAYAAALAHWLDVERLRWTPHMRPLSIVEARNGAPREVRVELDGREVCLLDAASAAPDALAARISALRALGLRPAVAATWVCEQVVEELLCDTRIDMAVNGLRTQAPLSSATGRARPWQYFAPVIAIGLIAGGMAVLPEATLALATGLMALPFLCVTILRGLALPEVMASPPTRRRRKLRVVGTEELPFYTVLVPLFRETRVLPDLVTSLAALDYPPERHEVLLLIESIDLDMQAALLMLDLPRHFRVLHIPDCQPRTKPKALNYALQFARGSYVVVYDAEDRPQPGQLRLAVETFRRAPTTLGCAQARLNIYNPHQSWISRQFTIEYTVLFDAILPTLERYGLPVPLGGTSNHFRRETLERVSAWDPFNVTEDADLGIRLARLGYTTAVLNSTTWEEAPTTFGVWLRQRTRWVKGWMQTLLVHTRDMSALHRELGAAGTLGFHAIFAGLVMSALVQPLYALLFGWQAWTGRLLTPAESTFEAVLLWIALGNLAVGYIVSILVGIISVLRRGRRALALHALLMPVYWLLISFAAYRALWQLVRAPYLWEKTPHGAAKPRARRQAGARRADLPARRRNRPPAEPNRVR